TAPPPGPGSPGGGGRMQRLADQHKDLIPALIEALKDKDDEVRKSARSALANLGPDSVDPLMKLLECKDKDQKINAALTLGEMGFQGRDSVPLLIKMLKDEDKDIRRAGAQALSNVTKGGQYYFTTPGGPGVGVGTAPPPPPPPDRPPAPEGPLPP